MGQLQSSKITNFYKSDPYPVLQLKKGNLPSSSYLSAHSLHIFKTGDKFVLIKSVSGTLSEQIKNVFSCSLFLLRNNISSNVFENQCDSQSFEIKENHIGISPFIRANLDRSNKKGLSEQGKLCFMPKSAVLAGGNKVLKTNF